jgi:phosphoserine phosphatase
VIVAFTASGFDELEALARAAGADDVLFKPYREAELLERLAQLLGVKLMYEREATAAVPGSAPPPADEKTAPPLAEQLRNVPAGLLEELREAALRARPALIHAVAQRIASHAGDAAARIHELAKDFRYDDLTAALEPPARGEASTNS